MIPKSEMQITWNVNGLREAANQDSKNIENKTDKRAGKNSGETLNTLINERNNPLKTKINPISPVSNHRVM